MSKSIKLTASFAKEYHQYHQTWWARVRLDDLVRNKPSLDTVHGLELLARAAKDEQARGDLAAGSFEDLVHIALQDKLADVAAAICRSKVLYPLLQHILPREDPKKLETLARSWTGSVRASHGSRVGPKTIEAYWLHNQSSGFDSAETQVNDLERNNDYGELVRVLEFLAKSAPHKNAMRDDHHLYRLVYNVVEQNRADEASAILASPYLHPLVHYNHPRIAQLRKVGGGKKTGSNNK